ncbi:MAG: hypothetical protein RLZZ210_612 [Pseudomonadota bacterium]|jgi:type IV secretory pathway TrbD component
MSYGMERLPLKVLLFSDAVLLFFFDFINAVLAFNIYSLVAFILFLGINIFVIYALRKMAEYDPQMIKSYLRSQRYQNYYSARSSVHNTHLRNNNFLLYLLITIIGVMMMIYI